MLSFCRLPDSLSALTTISTYTLINWDCFVYLSALISVTLQKQRDMGIVVKLSKNSSAEETKEALEKLSKKILKQKSKTLKDYFGKLPGSFGDGLEYQKKK